MGTLNNIGGWKLQFSGNEIENLSINQNYWIHEDVIAKFCMVRLIGTVPFKSVQLSIHFLLT